MPSKVPVLEGSLRQIGDKLPNFTLRGGPLNFQDAEIWTNMDENTMGYGTQHFLISCGTITLKGNLRNKTEREVLVTTRPHLNGAYMLPKGRKDIHDNNLWEVACRETQEETSIAVEPLYLKSKTRFTIPSDKDVSQKKKSLVHWDGKAKKVSHPNLNEVILKDIIFSYAELDQKHNSIRHVFFYPAKASGDGTISLGNLSEEDKKSGVEWCPIDKAIENLTMRVEKEAVKMMKSLLDGMTEEDWNNSKKLSGEKA